MKRVLLLRWNLQRLRGVVTFPWAASRVWNCGTLRQFQEQGEALGEILGLIAEITQPHEGNVHLLQLGSRTEVGMNFIGKIVSGIVPQTLRVSARR